MGWPGAMPRACVGKEWMGLWQCALPTLSLGGFALDKQAVPKGSSGFPIHFHDPCAVRITGDCQGRAIRTVLQGTARGYSSRSSPSRASTHPQDTSWDWGRGGEQSGEGGCVGNGACSALCHEAVQVCGDGRVAVHVDRLGLGSLILTRGHVFMDFFKSLPRRYLFHYLQRE